MADSEEIECVSTDPPPTEEIHGVEGHVSVEYVPESTNRSLSSADSKRLMNLIQQHTVLYESSNLHDQRAKEAKEEAWHQITRDFGDVPTWELTRRYKNIRTAFGRFLRRSLKRQDGRARPLEKSPWAFLAWLKPYIKHKFDYEEEGYVESKLQQQQPPSFAVIHQHTSRSPTILNYSSLKNMNNENGSVERDENFHEISSNDIEYGGNGGQQGSGSYQQSPIYRSTHVRSFSNNTQQPVSISAEGSGYPHHHLAGQRKRQRLCENEDFISDNNDEDALFLRSLIPQLRRIKPQEKLVVKTKILKLMHDGEFALKIDE